MQTVVTAYLFEFIDREWLPVGLRLTLRDLLDCVDSKPFRDYYGWVANRALEELNSGQYRTVVELGAGSAPLSRHLASTLLPHGTKLVVTDITPDKEMYRALEESHPGVILPCYESVDFSQKHYWGEDSLLLLSGTFHHLPFAVRRKALEMLTHSGSKVMVSEPLRKNLLSIFLVFLSVVPALLLPLWYLGRRPGTLRRVVWCWLIPVAAPIFCWDGIVSVLRYWSDATWVEQVRAVAGPGRPARVEHTLLCTMIAW
jgi:hypothetical protein